MSAAGESLACRFWCVEAWSVLLPASWRMRDEEIVKPYVKERHIEREERPESRISVFFYQLSLSKGESPVAGHIFS